MFTCVLRSGGEYTPWHVKRLQEQLGRPLECLTDISLGGIPQVTEVPLLNGWKGWWSKIELFRLEGPRVYVDLDVSIVGDPDKLITDEFTMWADPLFPGFYNSSVMSWKETPVHVYAKFLADPDVQRRYRRFPKGGDQGFIQDHVSNIKAYDDDLIRSYRAHVQKGLINDGAVVIAYHGKPKPWDM